MQDDASANLKKQADFDALNSENFDTELFDNLLIYAPTGKELVY